jgi:hypothetical protein
LEAGSHGFSLCWDPLLLLELFGALSMPFNLLVHFIYSCLDSIKLNMLFCTHSYYCGHLDTPSGLDP